MHAIYWYALVGWVAGWVTGRAMKGSGQGSFGDAFLGLAGGLAGGWLMRNSFVHYNWGLLINVLVATAVATFVTWSVRKLGMLWQRRQIQHQHA